VVSPKYFEEQSQLNLERAASGTMKKQPRILPLPLRKLRVRVRMTIPSRAECIGSAAIFRVDPFDSIWREGEGQVPCRDLTMIGLITWDESRVRSPIGCPKRRSFDCAGCVLRNRLRSG
jgi:hypothetical protein